MIGQNNTQKENRHNANNDYWYRQRIVDKIHEMHSKNNAQKLWFPKVMDNLNFQPESSLISGIFFKFAVFHCSCF